ncbi:murein biosynthesis integral membrane protein MurJ [Syntrophomonas wolfei]|uniref:murein biosynthesis integral membrane protein MurJ n=1 Tax=Syntrophomonas wolfei TaxID=863 RepID=UPI0007746149|nr:murein biosynthesis integral membrane protein MurJ [Syntrophomonas wolfei]
MRNKENKTGKNFIGVSILIFFSKLLGFARDIVFASVFGTTILTDAFQVIFSFPSLLFSSIGMALSSVNIPDLTYFVKSRSREERNRYIASLYAQITIWGSLIALLGIIFAPALTQLIAPGLSGEVTGIATFLTRIMMPTLLFVSLTYLTTGVLQVHGYFMLSAVISIPFNLLIIGALLLRGADIIILGYVTTAGWFLQFLIQVPVLVKEKYRFLGKIEFKNEKIINLYKNLLPILLGNSLLQLCLIIDRSFATHLSEGTTAALAFGSNLFITATSIFIVAMSIVVFPRLSEYCLQLDYERMRETLAAVFKVLLFILLPYLLLVVAYNREIITLVYERGAFTSKSTAMTSLAFLLYSLAVVGYACQEIFNRVFYALKKFHIPMKASLLCLLINLLLDFLLFRQAGIAGISLSTSFCLLLYGVIMSFMVRQEVGSFVGRDFLLFAGKLSVPAGAMLGVVYASKCFFPGGPVYAFLLPLLLSAGAYLGAAWVMGLRKDLLLK